MKMKSKNPFSGLYVWGNINYAKIAEIVRKMERADTPRCVICDHLRELWKENGDRFTSSSLSWILQF